MARVKDLWLTTVRTEGADGKTVTEKRKTARHPSRGGNKDAKRWLAIWIDPDGNEASKAFATQGAAKAYGKKQEADVDRGEYIAPKAGRELFGGLSAKYIRLRKVGASTRERYEAVNRIHVAPVFAHRAVKAPRPSDILEWLRGPMAKWSGTLQSTAYLIVAGTFDLAVADGLRRDNPARSPIITPPEAAARPRQVWSAERVWRVRDAHPDRYRALAECSAGLGLRRGCAFGIGKDDFDFDAEKVTVQRQVVRVGGKFYFKLPKYGKARTAPLPRGVAAAVRAHMEKYPPVTCTLPWLNEDGTAGDPVTTDLLFSWESNDPRTSGQPIREGCYDQGVWLPALAAAGVIPERVKVGRNYRYAGGAGKDNGLHALRHVYSTILQDARISPKGVTEFMGHSEKSLPVTFRIYGHVTEETFEQARQAVDSKLFRLRTVKPDGTVTELRSAQ